MSQWHTKRVKYLFNVHLHCCMYLFFWLQWQSPHQIEVSGELVERGLESKEKDIQAEREGKVLAQLFLSKSRYVYNYIVHDDITFCLTCEQRVTICKNIMVVNFPSNNIGLKSSL